jgi:hypothetical protein
MAILKVIPSESRSLEEMIDYVYDDGKALFINGIWILDIKDPLKEFWLDKWAFRKLSGVQYKQIILSFTTEESRQLSVNFFIRVVKEVAIVIAAITQVQMVYAVHGNTDNIHVHFVLNSVSPWTGKKLQINNHTLVQLKLNVNYILNKFGLQRIRLKRFEKETVENMGNNRRYL